MKNLEMNQMESLQGGTIADCVAGVASGVGFIGSVAGVAAAATPLGWAFLGVAAVGVVASGWDGDPCEEYAG